VIDFFEIADGPRNQRKSASTGMSEIAKPERHWYQHSLRMLLLVVFLAAIGMSWFAVKMQNARTQQHSVEAITQSGGWVKYDYQYDQSGRWMQGTIPPKPDWLRELLGRDFFATAVFCSDQDA